jgi:bla regulator protein blaR1
MTPLANHVWQSTLFAAMAWLLTLALEHNRAAVRYWLWFSASIKFLIPFSLLVSLGSRLPWRPAAISDTHIAERITAIGQPFAAAAYPTITAARSIFRWSCWSSGSAASLQD